MIFDGFSPVEGSPLYRQIIRHIQRGLAAGTIRYGDELPSRRTLSALLGVNPNTVARSYDLLSSRGIIFQQRGIGFFVASDALDTIKKAERQKFIEEEFPAFRMRAELLGINIKDLVK